MPKTLTTKAFGEVEIVDSPIPTPGEDQVLVKNVAVAQNPIDWQCVYDYYVPQHAGAIIGMDYAGVVVSVGPGVTRYQPGDRIAGLTFGGIGHPKLRNNGAFSEYTIGDATTSLKIPDGVSFEDASTLGTAVTTIGQSLYQSLDLPWPPAQSAEEKPSILIWGGSSSMGTMGVQYAHLSGYKVISTASPKNFELVKSMGADEVFDYRDPDVVAKIKAASDNKLKKALDCICLPGTTDAITASFGPGGGKVHNLHILDMSIYGENIESAFSVAFSATGIPYSLKGFTLPADPGARIHSAKFWKLTEDLLSRGKLKTHPVKIVPGGLSSVFDMLKIHKEWKVSGEKLVYLIADTPGAGKS